MGHDLAGSSVPGGPDDYLAMQWWARYRINFHAMLLPSRAMPANVHDLVRQQQAGRGQSEPSRAGDGQLKEDCRPCNATCMR
jgi:hypothetical protein